MIEKKVAIALMARDCAKSLHNNIPEIEKLVRFFVSYDIFVVENDSIDGTKEILKEWGQSNKNVHLLIKDNEEINYTLNGNLAKRIQRIAFYRNKYLQAIYDSKKEYDYLIIIDIDIKKFNSDSIIKTIEEAPENWEALFANGRKYTTFFNHIILGNYYDAYAYLPYDSIYADFTDTECRLNYDKINNEIKTSKDSYIKCDSAFAGIGIYKFEYIKNHFYQVKENNRSSHFDVMCEHIPFNLYLKHKYICKNLILLYDRISFIQYLKEKIISQKFLLFITRKILRKQVQD